MTIVKELRMLAHMAPASRKATYAKAADEIERWVRVAALMGNHDAREEMAAIEADKQVGMEASQKP